MSRRANTGGMTNTGDGREHLGHVFPRPVPDLTRLLRIFGARALALAAVAVVVEQLTFAMLLALVGFALLLLAQHRWSDVRR